MKRIPNEIKVGITALLIILSFIWLYSYLKGQNLFTSTKTYWVVYDEVNGLAESSPVEISGYKVGIVQGIEFLNDGSGRLLVGLSIDKHASIPEGSVAEITTATLIAGMKIQMIFGSGQEFYANGDTIPGRLAVSIIDKLEGELGPLKSKISDMMTEIDSLISSLNQIMDPEFRSDTRKLMANLSNSTQSINTLLDSRKSDLDDAIKGMAQFSAALGESSKDISSTVKNLEAITDTIANSGLQESLLNLRTTLNNASALAEGLQEGEGTAGKLMKDDSLYINLNRSVESLDKLLIDLKENPKKYVHFSLFGKKQK